MTFALGYDQPLAMTTATASVYFGQDAPSSVTSITNGSGDVVGRYGCDTYGQITSHTGQDSPYTYTGRQYNPQADSYDYRARWYEPASGRFLTQDPVPAANQYWYADGSPVEKTDPTGRMGLIADSGMAEDIAAQVQKYGVAQFTRQAAWQGGKAGGGIGFATSFIKARACGEGLVDAGLSGLVGLGRGAVTGAATGGVIGASTAAVAKGAGPLVGVFGGIGALVVGSISAVVYDAAWHALNTTDPEYWRIWEAGAGVSGATRVTSLGAWADALASTASGVVTGCD